MIAYKFKKACLLQRAIWSQGLRLTCHFELNEKASDWLSVDLTLVSAGVPLLDVLDLKGPLVSPSIVDRVVPHVSRVGVPANSQNVKVMVPDPRDLQHKASSNRVRGEGSP